MNKKYWEQTLREEKEPKPKLFGPDIFGWKRWGPKSSACPLNLKPRETELFGRDFSRDITGAPEKFEKKKFVFNFLAPTFLNHYTHEIIISSRLAYHSYSF